MGAVKRISLYNMIVILLSVISAAIVVAISIARHPVSFGHFNGTAIAGEDVALPFEGARRSRVDGPIKQRFLIVLLPDGKLVDPRGAEPL